MKQSNGGGWCQCAECGRTFGGLTGFDLHRADVTKDPYDWRCATDEELAAKGLHLAGRAWRQDGDSSPHGRTETPVGAKSP